MTEAGDTDPASLSRRLNLTIPLGDDPQALREIKLLAERLEVSLEKLIGRRLAAQAQRSVTDAEYVEVPTASITGP
jgi:hypothetical protein